MQNFRSDFSFTRELPENLQALETLSWNYWWSWSTEGVNIFHDLDPQLWEDVEQNPRSMLRQISDLRLLQKANDPGYVERVAKLEADFRAYLDSGVKTLEQNGRAISARHPVAYFCAEYGVHNSLPIYSGGLGILAGDHVKSASDLGLPLVAVGLMYRYGYFRQKLDEDKYQQEQYADSFAGEMPLKPVLGENGERITITVSLANHPVHAQAWKVEAGKTLLYLLDTNIPENNEADRPLTGYLYGGDRDTRVMQEILLGIGGVRLLRKLNIDPSVFHLNEGHSAFLTLELARELLKDNELTLDEVVPRVRDKCVFTTHTPIAAGNDVFPTDMIEKYFSTKLLGKLRISLDEFLHLGSSDAENGSGVFGMTPLAIRMCRSANGVSKKHGEVSREMWVQMFPQFQSAGEVPITHITNGVHAPTWIAPSLKTLYEKSIGENWQEILRDGSAWNEAVEKIPDREIWQIHRSLKRHLIAFIRHQQMQKYGYEAADVLDPNILTIGFARRVAAYKRWNLMLHDAERLYKMMDNAEGPVQFVFAGKPHPHDQGAKLILQELLRRQNPAWKQRSIFIEDYDQEVARFLVQGVDVWMNLPRRPLEASGTSGQKAAMNGALNLSIADGWWMEGYDPNHPNGWVIGVAEDDTDDDAAVDAADAESLYSLLENEVIPTYYRRNKDGIPADWLRMMKNSLQTLTYNFSSDRMLRDYVEDIYLG
ncbi:MAG TPA: alpha-glucan family phosphorylase [Pyrinomonadaceae bacterium]|nr:alpha-glucan family phosphorylase [Pyrinomonadaceae bacterium]